MGHRLLPVDPLAPNLASQIFERVAAAIADGRFAPGEVLHVRDIADALSVSRTPVREALQRLERIGMVEVSASRFTRVTSLTDEMIRSTAEFSGLQLGIAFLLAVPRLTDDQTDAAIAIIDDMEAASQADDSLGVIMGGGRLVALVTEHTDNTVFQTMMIEASPVIERALRSTPEVLGGQKGRDARFEQIRRAFRSRDAEAAERWARASFGTTVSASELRPEMSAG